MKTRSKTLRQLLFLLLGSVGLAILTFWLLANSAQRAFEQTREELRRDGFKTDLSEFDFSAGEEGKVWESILRRAMDGPVTRVSPVEHPDLMPAAGSNVAIAIWKHEWMEDVSDEVDWQMFNAMVRRNQSDVDAAAHFLISGTPKLQLDASKGMSMSLPSLPMVKGLAQTLGSRIVLELHDGNTAAAWTNLLAQTRLVTANKPAATDIEHLVRFSCLTLALNSTWQALQTNARSDAQLAQLQPEWERVNLFETLPEVVAFRRAGAVAACQWTLKEPFEFQLAEIFKEFVQSPRSGWAALKFKWQEYQYRIRGCWHDQSALLIYFRDREVEMRNAIRASTWQQMRAMPGVTNVALFESKFRGSKIQAVLNLREIGTGMFRGSTSFLGRAAEAEARRRILITAIALERYRKEHGTYPVSLEALTPKWLNVSLPDFITGEPLRYDLGNDGRFVLYSPGLDGMDNGGLMRHWTRNLQPMRLNMPFSSIQDVDLVWPRAATTEEITAYEAYLLDQTTKQFIETAEEQSNFFWKIQLDRQHESSRLLGKQRNHHRAETFHIAGKPVERLLQPGGTNSLEELLTLLPISTGLEPEILTFELPIEYAALTNVGTLRLVVDAMDTTKELVSQSYAYSVCEPGPNGNVRLTWHTIFETPGAHVVQALLEVEAAPPDFETRGAAGPTLAVTFDHLCQFGMASTSFDTTYGAPLHMRFPEPVATYTLEILSTNGQLLRTFSGATSNGTALLHWDLTDDKGKRWNGNFFESRLEVTLPASGRSKRMKGP